MRIAVSVLSLISLLLAALASPVLAQQPFPASAVIRGENIRLRAEPAEETADIAILQRGESVTITGAVVAANRDEFYPVAVDATGAIGWVRVLFIDPDTIVPLDVPVPVAEESPQERPRQRDRQAREEPAAEAPAPVEAPVEVPAPVEAPAEAPAPAPEPPAEPAPAVEPPAVGDTPQNPAPMGTLLRGSGLAVTVSDGIFRDEIDFATPKGGYKYLEVSVRIKNIGTEDSTYGQSDFSAQDATTAAGFDSVFVLSPEELTFDTLSPDEYVTGNVYFEVQETTSQAIVKFDPNPFTEGDLYWLIP